MKRLPSLRNLEAFIMAARSLNFRDAADALHVTPSAISRRIKTLEEEVGTHLFDRSERSLTLSPAGSRYLQRLLPIFDALRAAALLHTERDDHGSVMLSVYPEMCHSWVASLTGSLEFQAAQIAVEMLPLAASHSVLADVVICLAPKDLQIGSMIKLFDLKLTPACRPEMTSSGRLQDPAELAATILIGMLRRLHGWDTWFAAAGLPPPVPENTVWVESLTETIEESMSGTGIGLVDPIFVRHLVRQDLLALPFDIAIELPFSVYMQVQCDKVREKRVQRFVDWIKGAVKSGGESFSA